MPGLAPGTPRAGIDTCIEGPRQWYDVDMVERALDYSDGCKRTMRIPANGKSLDGSDRVRTIGDRCRRIHEHSAW